MSDILLILYFTGLVFLIVRWKYFLQTGIKSWVIIFLFAFKLLAGFGITYLYGTNYCDSSDIYYYFEDAQYFKEIFVNDRDAFLDVFLEHKEVSKNVREHLETLEYWSSRENDFLIHERKPVIMLNFLFSFISFGNIYIHVLLMSFIAFLGQVAFFQFVKNQKLTSDLFTLIIVFLLPTFAIWSSTLLKEPLAILAIGLSLYFIDKYLMKRSYKYLFIGGLFLFLGLFLKAFVFICLFLPLVVFILFKKYPWLTLKKQCYIVLGLIVFLLVTSVFVPSSINMYEKLSDKQETFFDMVAVQDSISDVGSFIDIPVLKPTFFSFAENVLPAFTRVLFKPSFYEVKSVLYLPDVLQNGLLLLLVFFIPFKVNDVKKNMVPFLWFAVLFIIIYFSVIGLVVPVLGAIVRYKILALPFLFMFIMTFLKLKVPSKLNAMVFQSGYL